MFHKISLEADEPRPMQWPDWFRVWRGDLTVGEKRKHITSINVRKSMGNSGHFTTHTFLFSCFFHSLKYVDPLDIDIDCSKNISKVQCSKINISRKRHFFVVIVSSCVATQQRLRCGRRRYRASMEVWMIYNASLSVWPFSIPTSMIAWTIIWLSKVGGQMMQSSKRRRRVSVWYDTCIFIDIYWYIRE